MTCPICGVHCKMEIEEERQQLVCINGEWKLKHIYDCPKCGTVKVEGDHD